MKTLGFCLLIISLSVLQLKAQLDYTAPATTWGTATCTEKDVFQSPAKLISDRCGPYETFSLDLPNPSTSSGDVTFVDTKGSYSLAYTTGKMTINSRTFTSSNILFRYPSEHKLPNQPSTADSLEVQIELLEGTTLRGVLSFILLDQGTNIGYQNARDSLDVFTALDVTTPTSPAFTLDFAKLTSTIKSKIANGLFLNIFTYSGTTTYPTCGQVIWYVYGSPLITTTQIFTNFKTAMTAQDPTNVALENGGNNRPIDVAGGGSGSLAATRLCYTGYFKNYMNYNYGLWFGVVIIVGWFIVNLTLSEKPIKDTEYQETTWTNHPLYSLYHIGNDLFTRKTRMSLLLGTITIHALFSSVWYRRTSEENRTRGSNIIVYAVYSMLVDWVFIFILGSMLRGYYIAKHQYYKTKEEAWQQKSQNRIFAFYFCVFLLACVLWPFCVWNMGELHPEKDDEASNYWVASFFVGLALEMLVADPIICLLAKSITPLRNLIKHRGYMYDNICHETYLDHLKAD